MEREVNRKINKRPIIICFEGVAEYVSTAIKCAEEHGNMVILIGDNYNKGICKNWISMDDFNLDEYRKFRKSYKHFSPNPYIFELRCFKRYFLTYEYLKREKIEECIMCDADVLLYENMSEYDFKEIDVSVTRTCEDEKYDFGIATPSTSFWRTDILRKFINYFVTIYEENIEKLEKIWKYLLNNDLDYGISDMTLVNLFLNDNEAVRVRNWSLPIEINGAEVYIDDNINSHIAYYENEFKYNNLLQMKRFKFEGGHPYFYRKKDSFYYPVKALSIHAQGNAKKYMHGFYREINNVFYYWILNYLGKIRLINYKKLFYKELVKKNSKIIIYGIGNNGEKLYQNIKRFKKKLIFCDQKAMDGIVDFHGVKVISPDELTQKYRNSVVIITVERYVEEIREKLIEGGINANKIY